jgi:membrane protease YdiL (CAAX protease family)
LKNYLQVSEGENGWKRYLGSTSLSILFMIIGSIVFSVIQIIRVEFDGNENTYLNMKTGMAVGTNPNMELLLTHIVYLFWILGIWIGVRFIHNRSMRSLITAEKKVSWRRILWGFGMFSGLFIISMGIDVIFNSSDYMWNFTNFKDYTSLLLIVLLFVPIQTTTEELFFRGLILQWLGKKWKNPLLLSILIGIIFGSLHFANPEMGKSFLLVGLDYIVVGFALTYISIKTGSLELSIGAHAANNMIIFLFFASDDSVGGNIPSLFKIVNDSPGMSLVWSIIIFTVFYILSKRKVMSR